MANSAKFLIVIAGPTAVGKTDLSIRLAQHFNAITMIGNQVCAPIELPANSRHLDTYLANLTLTDKSFHVSAIGAGRALDGVRMMAIARGLTVEQLAADPGVTTIISVNSPRRSCSRSKRSRTRNRVAPTASARADSHSAGWRPCHSAK